MTNTPVLCVIGPTKEAERILDPVEFRLVRIFLTEWSTLLVTLFNGCSWINTILYNIPVSLGVAK